MCDDLATDVGFFFFWQPGSPLYENMAGCLYRTGRAAFADDLNRRLGLCAMYWVLLREFRAALSNNIESNLNVKITQERKLLRAV